MNTTTFLGNSPSLIPQDLLDELTSRQPIATVVQQILWEGVYMTPLTLGISLSTFDNKTNQGTNYLVFQNIPYELGGIHGLARVNYPIEHNPKRGGDIHLSSHNTVVSLHRDTREQIFYLLEYSELLRKSEIIHEMPRHLMSMTLEQSTIRYSDDDGNVYFLYSPKINRGIPLENDAELHKSIRSVCIYDDGTMKSYRVMSSYCEGGGKGKNKKILLIAIEKSIINSYDHDKFYTDKDTWQNDLRDLSQHTKLFSLSVETLRQRIGDPDSRRQLFV